MAKVGYSQCCFDFAVTRHYCGETALDTAGRRRRLWTMFAIALLWSGVLVARLFSLQISNFETWQDWALKQHFAEVRVASERGAVYDRQGKLMAVSVPAGSVYARPRQIADKKLVSAELATILGSDSKEILRTLSEDKPFVWVKRQIPRAYAEKVEMLKLPGVGYMIEARRFYPYNQAASQLIGRVGIDGVGLSGVEAIYERRLRGKGTKTRVIRDAFGNMIDVSASLDEDFELPKGNALKLTIDAGLQVIIDEELEAGRINANAAHAMALMIDADSGEVLAMSQAPAANFNRSKLESKRDLHNLLVETVFEPGSIMKPIVAAAALEERVVSPAEMINCEHGRLPFGKHVIKDVHPSDTISFHDVVVRSSNIGMTKVGVRLGEKRLHEYLRRFGFGDLSTLGLPGETRGILRPLDQWSRVDVATHSFGQGVAVTPLQMTRAMAALANGGLLPELYVVNDGQPHELKRVVSERTAETVREMLLGVVEDQHGTGKQAAIPGVRVGGKTGTAQKARSDGRGYKPDAYIASFVGFVDAQALGMTRKIVLAVMIDEPRGGSIYGGALAAPVFRRVMQRSLHYLTTRNEIDDLAPDGPEFAPKPADPAPRLVPVSFSS